MSVWKRLFPMPEAGDLLRLAIRGTVIAGIAFSGSASIWAQGTVFPGADETTPSMSQYFSWINNTNEGSTEAQTMANLDFFRWLHDEYGMVLDIYAFDAGNIDGPGRYYGSLDSDKFRRQFPNGFEPIYEKAKSMGCRLGVWLGPDGFGDTPEDEQARIDLLVRLCRDYEFTLFKIDGVCGPLRPEKQDAYVRALTECRKYQPGLIVLNHRLELGKALPYVTTRLWQGAETYIDVHMANWSSTGTHNRVRALRRGLAPGLQRLFEDHGVCISSCPDYWDDDLVLQSFNRCLILAPQIYGNPWFLRDDEYPKLARIYNIHRRYRDILINGTLLPGSEGTAISSSNLFTETSEPGGLTGRYFTGGDFGRLTLTRTDPAVDFDWGTGPPHPDVGRDNFSVRWTGQILTNETGEYTFSTFADDGVHLWVDDKLIIDDWNTHAAEPRTGRVVLKADTRYDIKLEYFEAGGGAVVKLGWKEPGHIDYGPFAVSRGDGSTRFITLRNLTWNPETYRVKLDSSIGLAEGNAGIELRRLHPAERIFGTFKPGAEVEVEVLPFRSCLLMATTEPNREIGVFGCDYEVVRDAPADEPVVIELLGFPGSEATVKLAPGGRKFSRATLDGGELDRFVEGRPMEVTFPGEPMNEPWHRKLGDLNPCAVPSDAESLYETTCFAADNDPLEIRSLRRSGPSRIPQVQKARHAFLDQDMLAERGILQQFLFDGDMNTVYRFDRRFGLEGEKNIRLDFGALVNIDTMTFVPAEGEPVADTEGRVAEISADLKSWKTVEPVHDGTNIDVHIAGGRPVRYFRTNIEFGKVAEVRGFYKSSELDRSEWRSSYLFSRYAGTPAAAAWSHTIRLHEAARGSYLCIALDGAHGPEGAYAALRIGERLVGAPTRAPSYPGNVWEYPVVRHDRNYTFYVPVTEDMVGKDIEVVVLGFDRTNLDFQPSVWITANPIPYEARELVLH